MTRTRDSSRTHLTHVDPDLLEPLGLVTWAGIRLHHSVRDAINWLTGAPSDEPWDAPLGRACAELRKLAKGHPNTTERDAILKWLDTTGGPAVEARNGVAHAIAYTDPDGRQALRGSTPERPRRYLTKELLQVASQIEQAAARMPRYW